MHKFSETAGKLYAIMNWSSRKSSADVAILKYLTPEETRTYQEHKNKGLSDTTIFQRMFPVEKKKAKGKTRIIQVDIRDLTKKQLARLIEKQLNEALPSLEKMSRADLEKLLLKLRSKS